MPHFFVNTSDISENEIKISDKQLINHLVNARRIKIGEKTLFLDENKVQYETTIQNINKNLVTAKIEKKYPSERILDIDLTVARCILKQDAEYSAIQKATELGVKTIIPLISDNCTVKHSVAKERVEKYQKIADESVKQCERADFPIVLPVQKLEEFLTANIKNYDKILIFSEREKSFNIKQYFQKNKYVKNDKILAIIGCEGGFSQKEFELFEKLNLTEITLGKLILRADTALTAAIFGIIQEVS